MKLPRRNISAACHTSVGVADEVQPQIKIALPLLDSELPCVICYSPHVVTAFSPEIDDARFAVDRI